MTYTKFTIPGRPEGQRRPKAAIRGKHAGVYDPKENVIYADRVRWAWREAGGVKLEGPLTVAVNAYFARPKGHYTASGSLSAAGKRAGWYCTSKPDADNIAKAILDALGGLAFTDDAQVVLLSVTKAYAREGYVAVEARQRDVA